MTKSIQTGFSLEFIRSLEAFCRLSTDDASYADSAQAFYQQFADEIAQSGNEWFPYLQELDAAYHPETVIMVIMTTYIGFYRNREISRKVYQQPFIRAITGCGDAVERMNPEMFRKWYPFPPFDMTVLVTKVSSTEVIFTFE